MTIRSKINCLAVIMAMYIAFGSVNEKVIASVPPTHRTKTIPGTERELAVDAITRYLTRTPTWKVQKYDNLPTTSKLKWEITRAYRQAAPLPQVFLGDVRLGYSPYWDMHILFWKDHGKWQHQELTDFPNDEGDPQMFHAMKARTVWSSDGRPEIGMFFDSVMGSGSPVPVFVLMRLEHGRWRIIWGTPPVQSGLDHGTALYVGNGIQSFTLEYDSWLHKDERENVFVECHICPHRRYRFYWHRVGDAYRLASVDAIASPYNTLTEFIYLLSHHQDAKAAEYVTSLNLVSKARFLHMFKLSYTPQWNFEYDDPDRGAYLITSGPAAGTEITFVRKGTRFLISNLQP